MTSSAPHAGALALSAATARELTELEHAMWRAQTRYDLGFQERHFAPDFIEFGRSGRVYDRTRIILAAGAPIDARLENMRLRALGTDVVLITYDSIVTRAQDVVEHAHRSSLWTCADGTWRMRFHQGTPFSPNG